MPARLRKFLKITFLALNILVVTANCFGNRLGKALASGSTMLHLNKIPQQRNYQEVLPKGLDTNMGKEEFNIKQALKKLEGIINWFESREEMDIEAGLEKVKEGASLIKRSRRELKKVENEFEKIKRELEEEEDA